MTQRLKEIGIAFALTTAFVLIALFAHANEANARPQHHSFIVDASGNDAQAIGGRPAGCPHAYCGCALRKYLGLNDVRLNLAWNWARMFPRTSPHSGAAAVRHHHVMLLVEHIQDSIWRVRDYNGGRHLAWIHDRDVRGYVFVNPGNQLTER